MTTSARIEQEHPQEEEALRFITDAAQVLEELTARLGKHVHRAEVRSRLERYLQGLLAPVGRKNGWQMAEALGEANAHGVQWLLQEAEWDEQFVQGIFLPKPTSYASSSSLSRALASPM
ncbi:hypothetical protein KSC_110530 [Ktedonobacter sp. SOSP1-52]|uniref:transposase n=1 Tax=Ktedonobacter sp. SOSP1-52 TaxID=2778366 RepID=UPI001916C5DC|nr:hypothetical protein [Ktedonobacter sp. SOSP1-52]GHO72161.1 hypothetical protein KSC_110530 [Ktedonobacter sp. SOSP1-52]